MPNTGGGDTFRHPTPIEQSSGSSFWQPSETYIRIWNYALLIRKNGHFYTYLTNVQIRILLALDPHWFESGCSTNKTAWFPTIQKWFCTLLLYLTVSLRTHPITSLYFNFKRKIQLTVCRKNPNWSGFLNPDPCWN